MAKQDSKRRWNVERRLEFIDFRLYWDGHVNRGDLVRFFGISVQQASADLGKYQAAAKENILYDKTAKAYVTGPDFRPVFFDPSADHYLAQLRLLASGILTEEETWVVRLPSFSVVPILRRRLEAETLRRILEAIRSKASLHVEYQSLSRPKPIWRWISPHALGFDGFRWHARAWCHTRVGFRDFVLARILEVSEAKPSDIDPVTDIGWHREVTLKLSPHPAMETAARRAVELDYGMVNGVAEVRTRVCLSYYLERQLGLDLNPSLVTPGRQQIVLVNRKEVEAARKKAGASCCQPTDAFDEQQDD